MGSLFKVFQFLGEYFQDMILALKFNTYSPFEEKNRKLFYRITILTHAIEKGLSLENPRALFGQEKIHDLMGMIREYDKSFCSFPLEMAYGALQEYIRMHHELGLSDPFLDEVIHFVADEPAFKDLTASGGVKENVGVRQPDDLEEALDFLRTRFSCRSFKPGVLPKSLVEKIVGAAQWAPSQCNRQSVRVHSYQNKELIRDMLIEQGGAAGVYEGVYNLFIITAETTAWGGVGQRNQGYVDGGLLSYGLMMSAHAHGVATCALNLAVPNARESKLKKVGGIHDRERLIMMIAYGFPPEDGLKAARSPRLPASFILTHHG